MMKTNFNTANLKPLFSILFLCLLFLMLQACGKQERGSCNRYCGDGYQRISAESQASCTKRAKKSNCPAKWLPSGADENDRNAWITVYTVAERDAVLAERNNQLVTGDIAPPETYHTLAPSKPTVDLELTAANEVTLSLSISGGRPPDFDRYEIVRNGEACESCIEDYVYYYDLKDSVVFYDAYLDELTEYCYSVVAIDWRGNRSEEGEACVSTPVSPLIWTQKITIGASYPLDVALATDGSVYLLKSDVLTGDTTLQSLNSNGDLQWEYIAAGALLSKFYGKKSFFEKNGRIYFVTDEAIYCVNSQGQLEWSNSAGELNEVYRQDIYDSQVGLIYSVVFGTSEGEIRAIDSTGKVVWKYSPPFPREGAVVRTTIDKGSISIGSAGEIYFRAYSVNPYVFDSYFTLDAEGVLLSEPVDPNAIPDILNYSFVSDDGDRYTLYNYNLLRYTPDNLYYVVTANKPSEKTFIVALNNGVIVSPNWNYEISGSIVGQSIVFGSDGSLVFISYDEYDTVDQDGIRRYVLTALDKSGAKKWAYLFDQEYAYTDIAEDGSIYAWSTKSIASFISGLLE